MKKDKTSKNIILWVIVVLVVAIVFVGYLLSRLGSKKQKDEADGSEENDWLQKRLQELASIRDEIQNKRYSSKVNILYFRSLQHWIEVFITRKFNQFRWLLFFFVFSLFAIAAFENNFLNITTDGLLKYISVTAIMSALFFFAYSDENHSLATTYRRFKQTCITQSADFIEWFYHKFSDIDINLDSMKKTEHLLYLELVPVMDEIKELTKGQNFERN